jgi:membrane protein
VRHLLFRSLNALLGIGVNALFFGLVYRFMPKRPVGWRRALAGGLLAALLWEIGRQLLTQFLVGSSYTAYGVVGSFILMMLWFNYASMVLLYGAEYVAIGCQQDAAPCRPEGAAKQ